MSNTELSFQDDGAYVRHEMYTEVIADFIEMYGVDFGKKNAKKYVELEYRLQMLLAARKHRACLKRLKEREIDALVGGVVPDEK